MKGAVLFLALFAADAALAQDQPPIPDFQTCMDVYMDRYEQKLIVNRSIDIDAVEGGLWDVGRVYTCGGGGIVLCDRSDAPLPCQRDLADEQDALLEQGLRLKARPPPGPSAPLRAPPPILIDMGGAGGPVVRNHSFYIEN